MKKVDNVSLEEKDNKLILRAYRKLLRHSKSVISSSDSVEIKKAFRISLEAHKNLSLIHI